jgi:hypothetical protein
MKIFWLIGLMLGVAACAEDRPLTQIEITVGSDISETELDRITLEVRTRSGELLGSGEADPVQLVPLRPRKLTLVHEGGPLGPFMVTAAGWLAEHEVVRAKREVYFERKRTWHLQIDLEAACIPRWEHCREDETCTENACQPIKPLHPPAKDAQSSTDAGVDADPGGDEPPMSMTRPPDCTIDPPTDQPTDPPTDAPADPPTDAPAERTLYLGNHLELTGQCKDKDGVLLDDDAQRWLKSDDEELGRGRALEIDADQFEPGDHTVRLCATDPMGVRGCSAPLTLHVQAKPQPPHGKIDVVRQGDITAPGPFSTEQPISLEASGTSGVRFSWRDNFTGELAGDENATIPSPPIGRHQVTLTITDDAMQTYTDKIEFDVLDATRFEAGGHLIEPFQTINDELNASGNSSVTALATDSSGLGFVSNGEQVYAFQSDSQDAAPTPLSIDSESSETITRGDVTAILVWENGDDSRIYLGSDEGVLSCAYQLGSTPIESDDCQRYRNTDGEVAPDGEVSSLARLSIGEDNWLAIGTNRGLFVSDDQDGRMGAVMMVTSDQEPIRGVVAEGGSFWFATEFNGIYQYDVMKGQIPSLFSTDAPSPPFTALALDPSGGGIWMGSAGDGLGHFESRTGRWQGWMAGERSEGLASNTIQAVSTGYGLSEGLSREVIWVGTDRGLTRLDPMPMLPVFTTLTTDAGLPSDDVRAIAIAGQSGHVLVGTSLGLALYNGS